MSQPPSGDAQVAREAIIREAAGTIAYLAVVGAVSFIILKRDALTRAWMRLTDRPVPPRLAAEHRAVADFRRAVSEWEHGP